MAANRSRSAQALLRVKEQILLILATIAFIVLSVPLVIFLLVPCFIYRKLVSYFAIIFKPRLGKMLCARSALAAIDELYTNPKCTLLGVAVVEGDVDVESLRKDFMRRVISAKNSKGEIMYPEFQQYFSRWGGFLFWKWEKDFKIEDHVNVYEPSLTAEMGEMDVVNLRVQLIAKPYEKGISPWEFIVVKNYKPVNPLMIDYDNNRKNIDSPKTPKTVLIMRIHHGVTDGYSLLKLFLHTMQSEKLTLEKIPQPKFQKRSCITSVLYYTWAVLCVPYYVTEQLLATRDNNYFHPKGVELKRKCFAAGSTMSVAVIREVREKFNVTFSAVLTNALAGGIRSYMLANGIEVPESMHVTTPLPWPGHPSKLRNFWSFCITNLPLQVADSKERLKICHRDRESITRSTVPFLNLKLVPIVGSLPIPIIQWATQRKATTIMMSNFPGPQEPSSMFGYPILDASFGGGFGRGNLGFGISMISYNGTMRLGIGIDQSIIPSQAKVQELLNYIKEDIYSLTQDAIV